MSVVGIIAEFNPLHNGHKYLIQEAKKYGTVVCVISGNFVQRGDTAIFEKRTRAKMALECGADLVIELPVCYSMSGAFNFAFGGVSLLNAIGCDSIIFGSESGNIENLLTAANILSSKEYNEKLPLYLKKGVTFAKIRQLAAEECGLEKDLLATPNNNLAVEYILASKKINPKIKFQTIKRLGANHDSLSETQDYVSASLLRQKLKQNDPSFLEKYIPKEILPQIKETDFSDISRIENAILSVLRTKTKEELKTLPDISEGVENKLFKAIKNSCSLDELYDNIKVKRYTLARIRRLVLSAFLKIDNSFTLKTPPYLRVLGFNKNGEQLLKQNSKNSPIPVVLRVSEIENLGENAKRIFETECRATDTYALTFKKPLGCDLEYTAKLIKR